MNTQLSFWSSDQRLYTDGGVIKKNPSEIGGTWAARYVVCGEVKKELSGTITPKAAGLPTITNNLTEMLALLRDLEMLPETFNGYILSDSQITLGRTFQGWKWSNIPNWMHAIYQVQRQRLRWNLITPVLLAGHPTKEQLEKGIGKHGYPVSEHNVWCDKACGAEAEKFLQAQRMQVKR